MTAPVTWTRSADRRVWVAEAAGGVLLTVTMVSGGGWVPAAGGTRGPACRTRLAAQAWAERQVTIPRPAARTTTAVQVPGP